MPSSLPTCKEKPTTVLIINGAPRSGKDTLIEIIGKEYSCINYSSIAWIKDIAKQMGWEGGKTPRDRKFLAQLKDISTKYNNGPFYKIIDNLMRAKEGRYRFFCVCVREPDEIAKLLYWCNVNEIPVASVCVRNCKAEKEAFKTAENSADTEFLNFSYQYQVYNNGTLEAFEYSVSGLVETIIWHIEMEEEKKTCDSTICTSAGLTPAN